MTTGAVRRAKLQSNRHHQQINTQLFTGWMPFLSPNQQCQSTEGRKYHTPRTFSPPGCTHSYLLSGTDQPECSACHCPLTVKHILIECPALTSSRNKHFTASMKDLFDNVAARNIINFIKESHFYSTV